MSIGLVLNLVKLHQKLLKALNLPQLSPSLFLVISVFTNEENSMVQVLTILLGMIKQKIIQPSATQCSSIIKMKWVSATYIVLSTVLILVLVLWYNDTMTCLSLYDALVSTSQYLINNSTICPSGKIQKIVFLKTHKVRYQNKTQFFPGGGSLSTILFQK